MLNILDGSIMASTSSGLEDRKLKVSVCQSLRSTSVRTWRPSEKRDISKCFQMFGKDTFTDLSSAPEADIISFHKSPHIISTGQLATVLISSDSIWISLLHSKKNFLNQRLELRRTNSTPGRSSPFNMINDFLFFLLCETLWNSSRPFVVFSAVKQPVKSGER